MPATNFARTERDALADLFDTIGPDAPTLCAGWQTRDLAAHLVIRDRRPDAAAGILVKPLAERTERIRLGAAARRWETLVSQVRNPPALSMAGPAPLDRAVNTSEFFIHHEDVRRAQPEWAARELPRPLGETFYRQVKLMGKLRLRRFPAAVRIVMPGYGRPIVTGSGGTGLELTGDPGELTLFMAGRQDAARVTISGPEALDAKLRTWKLSL